MMQKIKFQDQEYILVNSRAITTEEGYKSGTVSFASLGLDGNILRYGSIIGTRDDIKFLEEIPDIKMTENGIANMLLSHSWFKKI